MTERGRQVGLVATLVVGFGCGAGPSIGGIGDDDNETDAGLDAEPAPDAVTPTVPRGIDGLITINEFMASNAMTIIDDAGAARDWVELFNPTGHDIPLHGYGFTDDLGEPLKAVIGPGVVIPAGGRVVLWPDGEPQLGATHVDFKLDADLGELGLARPDGSYIDRVQYGEQEVDFSAAREPDGSRQWVIEWRASPDAANPGVAGEPAGLDVASAPPEQIPAAGDLSEQVMGYDVMPELELRVSPAAAASLEVDPFTYVEADLIYEGRTYGPVGLRLKGQNSFQPFSMKPSLRINVDEYVERAKFWGLKDMTLNNMDNDLSMMHERLAYFVMRAAGIPASRCNHALLTVNGQFYGLYANVETVKQRMIGRWFEDDEGPLFEGVDADFVASQVPRYDLKSGPEDRSMLYGVASALTIASPDAALSAAGAHANLAEFRRYWAVASVIAQLDAFPYSNPGDDYFVYGDPTTDRLWFLPWGIDESFYSGDWDVTQVQSVLARRCRESPSCFAAYADETWAVQALTEQLDLAGERERVIAQITPYVLLDTRKPYSNEEVSISQNALYWFISQRREHLGRWLPPQ